MFSIENYNSGYAQKLRSFLDSYSKIYPQAKVLPTEYYTYHPSFAGGRNIYCVFDEAGNIIVLALLFPVLREESEAHIIWTTLMASPMIEANLMVKDRLWDLIYQRAREIKRELPRGKVRLEVDCLSKQVGEIAYFIGKGILPYGSRYQMVKALSRPIGNLELNQELRIVEEPVQWQSGITITALSKEDQEVGNITACLEQDGTGTLEEIFVLPSWRRKGIAKYLITQGLFYLKEKGAEHVYLEVLDQNRTALNLYRSMGFEILRKELLLGLDL